MSTYTRSNTHRHTSRGDSACSRMAAWQMSCTLRAEPTRVAAVGYGSQRGKTL